MNLRTDISSRLNTRRKAGFTMIEIAIALGVIAFALVAIIGVLPMGLQTQKDNREETVVNQDANVLMEALRSGQRAVDLDLGGYVVATNGVPTPGGISTSTLLQLLADPVGRSSAEPYNQIVFNSFSGAIATRGSDLGFRYEVLVRVTKNPDFAGTVLSNQMYEVRMRFAWPVLPNLEIANEAYSYKARTLVSGTYKDGFFYAQSYWNNIYTNEP